MFKTTTLRKQIIIIMISLVLLQSLAVIGSVYFSKIFMMLDSETVRLLNNVVDNRRDNIESKTHGVTVDVTKTADLLDKQVHKMLAEKNATIKDLYLNVDIYNEVSLFGANMLVDLLKNNYVTGAFFIINGSNTHPHEDKFHSGVFLRNTAPRVALGNLDAMELEMGPILVSQQLKIATANRWRLDLEFEGEKGKGFYHKVIESYNQDKEKSNKRHGYWTPYADILQDTREVITYSYPLVNDGIAYGIMGIEISLPYFSQIYLPDNEFIQKNAFYAIVSESTEDLLQDWFIPGGPLAKNYLGKGEPEITKRFSTDDGDMLLINFKGIGEMYCNPINLNMYGIDSPFSDEDWVLAAFVPQSELQKGTIAIKKRLMIAIGVTIAISIAASVLMSIAATRKIKGLSSMIKTLKPYKEITFVPTGLSEIDELMKAVELFNENIINSSKTTSKILELSLLPIGGYEVNEKENQVVLTEYVYNTLNRSRRSFVDLETWKDWYARLTAKPSDDYSDIYYYAEKWLRIIETPTDSGYVGVVLDVSKDINENLRLAHELDYDGLTGLYNRFAFHREVQKSIEDHPGEIGVMIFSDLDKLKYYNDNYGHDAGDRIIYAAGDMLRKFEENGGIVARISGDEFAVFLHGFESKAEIQKIVDEVFMQFREKEIEIAPDTFYLISLSSGLAWYPESTDNVQELIKLSDYAMYKNKRKFRA